MKNKLLATICFVLLAAITASAQEEVPMADQMRADGKIWVVLAVITIVFAGIIVYLISIDRKISKLEKQQ